MIVTSKYKAHIAGDACNPRAHKCTCVHMYTHTVGRMAQWIRALATKSNDLRDLQDGRREPTPEK